MGKIYRWIRRWSYIIMLVLMGFVFLRFSDIREVYAKPLKEAVDWVNSIALDVFGDVSVKGTATEESSGDAQGEASGAVDGGSGSGLDENDFSEGSEIPGGNLANTNNGTGTVHPPEIPAYRNPEDVVYTAVSDDYFADAVFIGDSRTVGMYEYGGLEEIAEFYASTGLTVYKLFDTPIVEVPGTKEKQTVEEALQERQFGKIYFMIGINEMGTGTPERFADAYCQAVERLKELQPEAVIYLQGIMKVTEERSGQGDYIHNEGIELRNSMIAELADNVRVYYLDINQAVCDESGGMNPSYTYDGVHLKAQYILLWKDFLKSHAVEQFSLD